MNKIYSHPKNKKAGHIQTGFYISTKQKEIYFSNNIFLVEVKLAVFIV